MKKDYAGILMAWLLGLLAAAAVAMLVYPGIHPSLWRPLAEAVGARPPANLFNGIWQGIVSGVFARCGVETGLQVVRYCGIACYGLLTMLFYFLAMDILTMGIKDYDRHERRRTRVKHVAAFVATIAFAASEPIWCGAQSFSPAFLKFFLLMYSLRCFTRYYLTESDRSLFFGMFVSGLMLAETVWAVPVILVGIGFFLSNEHGILSLSGTVSTRTRANVAKWRLSFIVAAGLLLMIAGNVTYFIVRDGLVANDLGPQRMIITSLRDYFTSFISSATTLGWIASLVLVVLPATLLLWAFRRAADEEILLPYGLGVCYFAGAMLALSQLSAVSPLWITSWSDRQLVPDVLFQMFLSALSSVALMVAVSVFGIYAFCHGHVGKGMVKLSDLANSDDYDGEREAVQLRKRVLRNYRRAKLCAVLVVIVMLAALVLDRGSWTVRAEMDVIKSFLDAVEADCKGLTYLFTDGRFDDAIRLRMAASGQKLHPFSFMATLTPLELRLMTENVEGSEDDLSVRQGAPTLLRSWMRDKPERLNKSGVQIGFELWQRDLKALPNCWGTLARTTGTRKDETASLARAKDLTDRILAYYDHHLDMFVTDRVVHDLFQTAQWRISRLARMRADKYDVAGRVSESKENLEWAKKLDDKNGAVKSIFRALREAQQVNLRKIAPREALHLALVRADFASARFYAEQIVSSAPNNPEANFAMAMSYVMQGHFGRAERHFEKCLLITPKDPTLLNNLAMCQLAQNKLVEARKNALLARSRAPDSSEIRRTLDDIEDAARAMATNGTPKKVTAPRIGTRDIKALSD